MSDDPALIHSSSDGGVAAKHPEISPFELVVAPSTANQVNTVRLQLVPIACFRVDDIRFKFDSSFVMPGIRSELRDLVGLLNVNPGSPLSVFGHADPVGSDDYNKLLSGRRAAAIYGLLTRRDDIWEDLFRNTDLFANAAPGDDWGTEALQIMSDTVAQEDTNAGQAPPSLPRDSSHRKQLFLAYMEKLCGSDLKLQKTDFLARGVDLKGKGDYQGCSEFNPVLIFSQQKQTRFQDAVQIQGQGALAERNNENAPNRRVMVLLFRRGSQVDHAKWPCPRAIEGSADCKKRFFSDGEKRRSLRLPETDRLFKDSKNTFACRFYQRLTDVSPCEALLRNTVRIWLLDERGQRMPAGTSYRLTLGKQVRAGRLQFKGLLIEDGLLPSGDCTIEWSLMDANDEPAEEKEGDRLLRKMVGATGADHPFLFGTRKSATDTFRFQAEVNLNTDHSLAEDRRQTRERLNNMGYPETDAIEDCLRSFEDDYGLPQAAPNVRKITVRDFHRDGTERPLTEESFDPVGDERKYCGDN